MPARPSIVTERLQDRTVKFASAEGTVAMAVKSIDYPYATGIAEPGEGIVEIDVATVREGAVLQPT